MADEQDRVIVVGDVHGCAHELERLLIQIEEATQERHEQPFYAFVGDLVDRGPDSARVVSMVRALSDAGRAVCILGNHEDLMLQALAAVRADILESAGVALEPLEAILVSHGAPAADVVRIWVDQGGATTLRSYGCGSRPGEWKLPPEDVAWIASLPLLWENHALVITHALATRHAVMHARAAHCAAEIKPAVREQMLWNREALTQRVDPQRLHVSGHTPLRSCVLNEELNTLQIDTGCVFGNTLSAVSIPDLEVFEATAARRYY